ncbi:MAG: DUF3237 family protein [Kiritimatiellae bacterium]|nr:DUF3237 family protein [Kiritimatiellia bacterium]
MRQTAMILFTLLAGATRAVSADDQAQDRPPIPESGLELRVTCGAPVALGEIAGKPRRDIPILGGTFEGANIKGVILKGGADRQCEDRELGVTWLDAEYDIMADDGTKIHVHNQGVATKEGFFRASPVFTAPAGSPHAWLNQTVFTCALTPVKDGVSLSVRKVARSRMLEDGGSGPHRAVMMEADAFAEHTLFRPIDLSPFNATNPLPVLVWGNGACANSPIEHAKFLGEIASYGYLVLATGIYPVTDKPYRGPMSRPEQQIESIDWAFARNADPKSDLYGKIDLKHICLGGMSCGGLQALHNCADKRIAAVMICNSGLFINPSIAMPNMPMPRKEKLRDLHTPVLYMLGGKPDIAYENGMDDFHRIDHVPAIAVNLPVGHGGTYRHPHGGEFSVVARTWLDWQLKGDQEAGKMFIGEECGLLKRKGWSIERNAKY